MNFALILGLMSPVYTHVTYMSQRDLCEDVAMMLAEEMKEGRKSALEVELHIKRCNEFVVEFETWE